MSRLQKLFVASICFIFLALIVSTPLSHLGRFGRSYYEMSENGHVISAGELDDFLRVWRLLVQKNVANYNNLQLSFSESNSVADALPSQLVRWLDNEGWGAERFFYDEQKIRELANIAKLQDSIVANRRVASGALGGGMNAILQEQEEQLKSLAADPRELEAVSARLPEIGKVLHARPTSKKKR